MSGCRGLGAGLALTVLSCAAPPAPPPAPSPASVRAVAVLPPNNRTGDPLLITGGSFFEKYIMRTERITVPDVLAAEARSQLLRRGFTVVAPETVESGTGEHAPMNPQEAAAVATRINLDGSVLFIDLRRWEPDGSFQPRFIIVWLEIRLIDPPTGRVLWTADHPPRPVPTSGVVDFAQAYAVAARAVIDEMLAGLGPELPAQ